MAPNKQVETPVTLFAQIESKQYDGLRYLAFRDGKSIAEITRAALDLYLENRAGDIPRGRVAPSPEATPTEGEGEWIDEYGSEGGVLEESGGGAFTDTSPEPRS